MFTVYQWYMQIYKLTSFSTMHHTKKKKNWYENNDFYILRSNQKSSGSPFYQLESTDGVAVDHLEVHFVSN